VDFTHHLDGIQQNPQHFFPPQNGFVCAALRAPQLSFVSENHLQAHRAERGAPSAVPEKIPAKLIKLSRLVTFATSTRSAARRRSARHSCSPAPRSIEKFGLTRPLSKST
jgi:hypothetical protein